MNDLLEQVISAAAQNPRTRLSPAHIWLRDRYRELEPVLGKYGVDWAAVAAMMTAQGVLDGRGAPIKPRTLQQTWCKVVRNMTGRKRRQRRSRAARKPACTAAFRATARCTR